MDAILSKFTGKIDAKSLITTVEDISRNTLMMDSQRRTFLPSSVA